MRKTSVLVLGFSVTAEYPGFVGQAKLGALAADYDIQSIGIGGIAPAHLKFLVDRLIPSAAPDIVILEIATAGLRILEDQSEDHAKDVRAILASLSNHKVRVGFLDLPRLPLPNPDWLAKVHQDIASELGLPYEAAPYVEANIKDDVHTTDVGAQAYGEMLAKLLGRFVGKKTGRLRAGQPIQFSCVPVADVIRGKRRMEAFSRAGFEGETILLAEGKSLSLTIPQGWDFCGLSYIIGPRSGKLAITIGKAAPFDVNCHDQWAYYERLGFWIDHPRKTGRVTCRQTGELPSVKLEKGEPNLDSRIARIAFVLLSRAE